MATVNKNFVVRNGIVASSSVQATQFFSTTSSLPPLTVTSSAQVDNLNVNYLGGYTAEYILSNGGVTSLVGTDNEISITASIGDIQVGLPSDVSIEGTLTVGENLVVSGSVVTVNSTVVTIEDPIFTLGGVDSGINDNKDRGVEFKWNDGSAKVGFFGFDDSTGKFTFIPEATNSDEVFTGTTGEIDAKVDWSNILNKPDSTITLTGDVTGTGTMTDLGNVSFSTTIEKDFDITLTGDVSGNVTVSNLGSASISVTISENSVALGTDTTGDYVSTITASANQINVSGSGESADIVLSLPQDINSTATPTFNGVDFDYGSVTSKSATITQNSTDTTIDSFSVTDVTTAEYLVQAKQGTKMTSEKIMLMWDGSDASISEYSIIDAAAGAANCTFSASYADSTIYLIASSLDAASTNVAIKVVRTSVVA